MSFPNYFYKKQGSDLTSEAKNVAPEINVSKTEIEINKLDFDGARVEKIDFDQIEKANLSEKNDISNYDKISLLNNLKERLAKTNIPYKDLDNTVFYDGDPSSPIMLVGEAPGEDEVKQGKPFVGKSGKLLQKMLDFAGLTREKIYITNVVPWRPPLNRTPLQEEIEEMRPYLLEHIKIIKPKILMCIGGVSYKCVTGEILAISKIRGSWIKTDFCDKVIATFHPSYLLRSQIRKKDTWNDILKARQELIEDGFEPGESWLG